MRIRIENTHQSLLIPYMDVLNQYEFKERATTIINGETYAVDGKITINSIEELFNFQRMINEKLIIKEDDESGQYINVNGERVYIDRVEYDIVNDCYDVYTDKILSKVNGNMTEEEARQKLSEIQSRGIFKRLFRRL